MPAFALRHACLLAVKLNTCGINFTILIILTVQFSSIKYSHTVVQPPPSVFRMFSSSQIETLHPYTLTLRPFLLSQPLVTDLLLSVPMVFSAAASCSTSQVLRFLQIDGKTLRQQNDHDSLDCDGLEQALQHLGGMLML